MGFGLRPKCLCVCSITYLIWDLELVTQFLYVLWFLFVLSISQSFNERKNKMMYVQQREQQCIPCEHSILLHMIIIVITNIINPFKSLLIPTMCYRISVSLSPCPTEFLWPDLYKYKTNESFHDYWILPYWHIL